MSHLDICHFLQRLERLKLRHITAEVAFLKLCGISVQYPTQLSWLTIGLPLFSLNSSDTDSSRQTETRTNKQIEADK